MPINPSMPYAHGAMRQFFQGRSLAAICTEHLEAIDASINGLARAELDQHESIDRIKREASLQPVILGDQSEWAVNAGLHAGGGADLVVSIPFTGSEELIDAASVTRFLGNAPDAPRGTIIEGSDGTLMIGIAASIDAPVTPQRVAEAVSDAARGLKLRLESHAETLRTFTDEVNARADRSREARRQLLSMADDALRAL